MGFWSALVLTLVLSSTSIFSSSAAQISHDGRAITIDGQRKVILSGSIHYPRSTPGMWPDLIQKSKDGGLNTIETYVFWNGHEPKRREYYFEGNYDIVKFIKTIQQAGMHCILRIGPYACAEWNYGGFPVWLHQMPGIQMRTDNKIFKDEMQNFTTFIVDKMREENFLASQGGPIILTQIENEYGNIDRPYGEAGKKYIKWCAEMAVSLNVGVPWIMCRQEDAPQPMINTCNGFYCDSFKPNNPNSPKLWSEDWTSWYTRWGQRIPQRPVEDVAFGVALFFQSGGTGHNYYMYHGGTNFGRTTGGPYLTTSYDYDSPIDEYGNVRQPKWGHLAKLHNVLMSMENALVNGEVNTTDFGNGVSATIYKPDSGAAGCFLTNRDSKSDATITWQGSNYSIPAWSVSILPDCKNEVYNTAKVNVQTSIMAMKPSLKGNGSGQLVWEWQDEIIKESVMGKGGALTANQLLEQKMVTGDASDYLWYMTSVNVQLKDPFYSNQTILRVNTSGHGLYAYFNGKLVGSKWADNGHYQFVLEAPVDLKPKRNQISLLSATNGLANYGSFFDTIPTGIAGGPVQLVGNGNATMDLSNNQWSYKTGLDGEQKQLYLVKPGDEKNWNKQGLPVNKTMTWYKTTFEAPSGEEPVVLDLVGMGKGMAWVNGQSIGRYWPSYMAPSDGCGHCDYRNSYHPGKCATGCGQPSQRWYHVPRSFLQSGENILVLFEEAGGDPSQVNFQTVAVETVCGTIDEGGTLELSCQGGRTISQIQFASFGDPKGSCGSFSKGTCEAGNALSVVQKACIGKTSCSLTVLASTLGTSSCGRNVGKRLTVQAAC